MSRTLPPSLAMPWLLWAALQLALVSALPSCLSSPFLAFQLYPLAFSCLLPFLALQCSFPWPLICCCFGSKLYSMVQCAGTDIQAAEANALTHAGCWLLDFICSQHACQRPFQLAFQPAVAFRLPFSLAVSLPVNMLVSMPFCRPFSPLEQCSLQGNSPAVMLSNAYTWLSYATA